MTLNTPRTWHFIQANQRNKNTNFLRGTELQPIMLGSVFLLRTGLKWREKPVVLQGKTNPPPWQDKSMRKTMEKEKVEQVGENRNKISPENGTPQKRTTIVSQTRANLTWQKIWEENWSACKMQAFTTLTKICFEISKVHGPLYLSWSQLHILLLTNSLPPQCGRVFRDATSHEQMLGAFASLAKLN